MQYKALLFDLDGTLLDSLADLAGSANRMLRTMCFPEHSVSSYRYFIGDGLQTLVERIVPPDQVQEQTILECIRLFRDDYGANWHVQTAMYEGIGQMLDNLTKTGFPMAILSNKPDDFTRACVDKLLPHWSFFPIFGHRSNVPKKPDPMGAMEVADELKLKPGDILYVGDTATDMETACRAGMDAVGVLWGFRTAKELESAGARYLISRPEELPALMVR